jgi:hypothetical protein
VAGVIRVVREVTAATAKEAAAKGAMADITAVTAKEMAHQVVSAIFRENAAMTAPKDAEGFNIV